MMGEGNRSTTGKRQRKINSRSDCEACRQGQTNLDEPDAEESLLSSDLKSENTRGGRVVANILHEPVLLAETLPPNPNPCPAPARTSRRVRTHVRGGWGQGDGGGSVPEERNSSHCRERGRRLDAENSDLENEQASEVQFRELQ